MSDAPSLGVFVILWSCVKTPEKISLKEETFIWLKVSMVSLHSQLLWRSQSCGQAEHCGGNLLSLWKPGSREKEKGSDRGMTLREMPLLPGPPSSSNQGPYSRSPFINGVIIDEFNVP